jgi:hypothetical protein
MVLRSFRQIGRPRPEHCRSVGFVALGARYFDRRWAWREVCIVSPAVYPPQNLQILIVVMMRRPLLLPGAGKDWLGLAHDDKKMPSNDQVFHVHACIGLAIVDTGGVASLASLLNASSCIFFCGLFRRGPQKRNWPRGFRLRPFPCATMRRGPPMRTRA